MAETTLFVIEGDVSLAYFVGEQDSKHVLIDDLNAATDGSETVSITQKRLEAKICNELGFPSGAEFDTMYDNLQKLREKKLRPVEGVPDGVREGVKLRITVEVL